MPITTIAVASFLAASSPAILNATNIAEVEADNIQDEIVVEEPSTGLERRNELRRFARDVLNKPTLRQTVTSYSVDVCPRVFGLPEDDAIAIETRMRANALKFGANRSDPSENCAHNTSVIFVPGDQGPADQWLNHGSKPLSHLRAFERARVLGEKGPVRAWNYRQRRTPGAPAVVYTSGGVGPFTFATGGFHPLGGNKSPNPVLGSVVIIELERAKEKSLIQLADYASMRTFANARGIDPNSVPAAQTILTLFQDDEDAPKQLTSFDRALISMLYKTPEGANRSRFYGNIARYAAVLEEPENSQSARP